MKRRNASQQRLQELMAAVDDGLLRRSPRWAAATCSDAWRLL